MSSRSGPFPTEDVPAVMTSYAGNHVLKTIKTEVVDGGYETASNSSIVSGMYAVRDGNNYNESASSSSSDPFPKEVKTEVQSYDYDIASKTVSTCADEGISRTFASSGNGSAVKATKENDKYAHDAAAQSNKRYVNGESISEMSIYRSATLATTVDTEKVHVKLEPNANQSPRRYCDYDNTPDKPIYPGECPSRRRVINEVLTDSSEESGEPEARVTDYASRLDETYTAPNVHVPGISMLRRKREMKERKTKQAFPQTKGIQLSVRRGNVESNAALFDSSSPLSRQHWFIQQKSDETNPLPDKLYLCTICSVGFARLKDLKEHSYSHRKKYRKYAELLDQIKSKCSITEDPFQCTKCDTTFKFAADLTKHLKSHKEDILSASSLKRYRNTKQHRKKKVGALRHSLVTESDKESHRSSDVTHTCCVCGSVFASDTALQEHMHHPERPVLRNGEKLEMEASIKSVLARADQKQSGPKISVPNDLKRGKDSRQDEMCDSGDGVQKPTNATKQPGDGKPVCISGEVQRESVHATAEHWNEEHLKPCKHEPKASVDRPHHRSKGPVKNTQNETLRLLSALRPESVVLFQGYPHQIKNLFASDRNDSSKPSISVEHSGLKRKGKATYAGPSSVVRKEVTRETGEEGSSFAFTTAATRDTHEGKQEGHCLTRKASRTAEHTGLERRQPNLSNKSCLREPRPSDKTFLHEPRSSNDSFAREPLPNDKPFLCKPRLGDQPVLCKPNLGDKPVFCEPSLSDRPVPCEPYFSDKAVLSEPCLSDRPVPCEPCFSDKAVLCEPCLSDRPIPCEPCLSDTPFLCKICCRSFTAVTELTAHCAVQHPDGDCFKSSALLSTGKDKLSALGKSSGKTKTNTFDPKPTSAASRNPHVGLLLHVCSESDCGASFPSKSGLNAHKSSHKRKALCSTDINIEMFDLSVCDTFSGETQPRSTSICRYCSAEFNTTQGLSAHQRVHIKAMPHKCNECTERFETSWNLKNHKRLHEGYNPFLCPICDASFSTMKGMNIHIAKHERDNLKPRRTRKSSAKRPVPLNARVNAAARTSSTVLFGLPAASCVDSPSDAPSRLIVDGETSGDELLATVPSRLVVDRKASCVDLPTTTPSRPIVDGETPCVDQVSTMPQIGLASETSPVNAPPATPAAEPPRGNLPVLLLSHAFFVSESRTQSQDSQLITPLPVHSDHSRSTVSLSNALGHHGRPRCGSTEHCLGCSSVTGRNKKRCGRMSPPGIRFTETERTRQDIGAFSCESSVPAAPKVQHVKANDGLDKDLSLYAWFEGGSAALDLQYGTDDSDTHAADTAYLCVECGSSFPDKVALHKHLFVWDSRSTPFNCYFCGLSFVCLWALKKHIEGHEDDMNRNGNEESLISSLPCHGASARTAQNCEVYRRSFASVCDAELLVKNAQQKNTGPSHLDHFCGKSFTSSEGLWTHRLSRLSARKRGERLLSGRASKSQQPVVTKKGQKRRKTVVGGTAERRHKCAFCGAAFLHSSHVKKHIRIHTGEKPFVCSDCGAAFTENGGLKRHSRVHTRDKPYHCVLCSKAYSDCSSLRRHLQTHPAAKPVSG